jgi:hypothetical protein
MSFAIVVRRADIDDVDFAVLQFPFQFHRTGGERHFIFEVFLRSSRMAFLGFNPTSLENASHTMGLCPVRAFGFFQLPTGPSGDHAAVAFRSFAAAHLSVSQAARFPDWQLGVGPRRL